MIWTLNCHFEYTFNTCHFDYILYASIFNFFKGFCGENKQKLRWKIWQNFIWIDRKKRISGDLRSSKFQNFPTREFRPTNAKYTPRFQLIPWKLMQAH